MESESELLAPANKQEQKIQVALETAIEIAVAQLRDGALRNNPRADPYLDRAGLERWVNRVADELEELLKAVR